MFDKFFRNNDQKSKRNFIIVSLGAFLLFFIVIIFINLYLHNIDFSNIQKETFNPKNNYKVIDKSDDPYIVYPALEDENGGVKYPTITEDNPVYGKDEAVVKIIYYSDYDCKYCWQQISLLKNIIDKNDNVQLIWKDYPELNFDSLSFQSAVAGRCAEEQDGFWKFQESFNKQFLTFKSQEGNNLEAFNDFVLGIAKENDINNREFRNCFREQETREMILEDLSEAQELDLPGVPFLFINNHEILGEYNEEDIEFYISEELEK